MLVGETSGGGTCAVNFCTTADGLFYSISSGIKFVDSEGKDIDNGIKPDYELVKVNDNGSKDFSEVYSFDKLSQIFGEYYKTPVDDPTPITTTTAATTESTTTTTTTVSSSATTESTTTTTTTVSSSATTETTTTTTTSVTTTVSSSATTPAVTTSSTTTTELPQTGNNSAKAATAAGCAVLLIVSGGIAVIRSKKED
jgi:LPXTG-motif cell wall-anchored protein